MAVLHLFCSRWGFGIWVCWNHILLMTKHWLTSSSAIVFPSQRVRPQDRDDCHFIHESYFVPEQYFQTPTVHITVTLGVLDIHGVQMILSNV